jgi:hypothetical protein
VRILCVYRWRALADPPSSSVHTSVRNAMIGSEKFRGMMSQVFKGNAPYQRFSGPSLVEKSLAGLRYPLFAALCRH